MLLIFFGVPMLELLRLSFFQYDPNKIYLPVLTFSNYIKFFSDSYFLFMIYNSLKVGIFSSVFALVFGYPIAYYVAKISGIERTIITAICLLPIFVTILVTTLGWYIVLLPYGVTQNILSHLNLLTGRLKWLQTLPSLVVVLVHLHIPFVILILASSIQNISEEKINAARILGASTYDIFLKIIIPLTMPAIVSSGILVFSLCISSYLIPILITGQTLRLLPMAIFSYTTELLNWPLAATIAVLLLIIVSVGTFCINILANKITKRGQWEDV